MFNASYQQLARAYVESEQKNAMLRSPPYLEGMIAATAWVIAGRPPGESEKPRYEAGTPELDAWLSGWERGKALEPGATDLRPAN
mgnify:FL=1